MGVDCAPAMTGVSFRGGWAKPLFNGVVVPLRDAAAVIAFCLLPETVESDGRRYMGSTV